MSRRAVTMMLALVLFTIAGAPGRAQSGGVILLGYGALSVGAIVRLVNRGPVTPASGSVIRARGVDDRYVVGRVTRLDADSLTVEEVSVVGRDSLVVSRHLARSEVREIDVNVGHTRSWATGWGIGLLSGAILGGVLGSASGSDAVFTRQESTVLGAIAVGGLGSMTGALIGLLTPDQWVEAEGFGHRRRIAVAPIVGPRTGVAAQLRF